MLLLPDAPPAGTPVGVVARDLAVAHPGRSRPAVAGVSFELGPGSCLLVVGPSGSGKSTLARALAGLVPWSVPGRLEGDLRVDGVPIGDLDPARAVERVGLVLQDPSSQLVMERAEDDVAFGLEGRRWPRDAMRARVPVALGESGLAGFDRRRTARLSGGEQQRLALAGALAPRPGLLVLDEPTSSLDPAGAAAFAARLAAVRTARTATIVLVEHRAELAWPLADLVLALGADGRPIAAGPPAELLATRRADLADAGIWLPDDAAPDLRAELPATGAARIASAGVAGGGAALVEARGVGFAYERGVPVLADVDLGVAPGERVALLGSNGSGKSTLGRLLVGLLRPTTGSIRLAGRDPGRLAPRELARLAGYVVQDPERGFLAATVEGEVLAGLVGGERSQAGDIAAALGLPFDRFGGRNPYTLSGGEQRRLSLAAQLVRRPRLLVLDEPTFGQDRRTYDSLLALLRERVAEGTAILAATHDLRYAGDMADRVVRLERGRLVANPPP